MRRSTEAARAWLAELDDAVFDGPFTETKEVIGGYAMLKADSMEHAIELTRRFLLVHGDEWELDCEVRPLAEQGCG